jgi:hypothetical protein
MELSVPVNLQYMKHIDLLKGVRKGWLPQRLNNVLFQVYTRRSTHNYYYYSSSTSFLSSWQAIGLPCSHSQIPTNLYLIYRNVNSALQLKIPKQV